MFCPKCGRQNPDDARFCSSCAFDISAYKTGSGYSYANSGSGSMTFAQAISLCMRKYATFEGRASRSEYWWFILFQFLLNLGASIVDDSGTLNGVVTLVLFLPGFSVYVRRLHDTDHSGWWVLISFTVIGLIPLFIWLVSMGDPLPNRYGTPT